MLHAKWKSEKIRYFRLRCSPNFTRVCARVCVCVCLGVCVCVFLFSLEIATNTKYLWADRWKLKEPVTLSFLLRLNKLINNHRVIS